MEASKAAAEIRDVIERLADAMTERHLIRHPDIVSRYGPAGRRRCLEDARFHLQYLAAALDSDSADMFLEYVAWTKIVLVARNITAADLSDNIQIMTEALSARLSAEAFAVARSVLEESLAALPSMPSDVPTFLDSDSPLARDAAAYLRALLEGNARSAAGIAAVAVGRGVPLREIYRDILEPVQREIGRLWQLNRITVAQEHYCTAATQQIMTQLYGRLLSGERKRRRTVAMCAGGEMHEVGLRIICDLLELDGWTTDYLGANVPPAAAVQLCADRRADVLLVSATLPPHIESVKEVIRHFRAAPSLANAKVIVGGRVFNRQPELWKRIGADGYAGDADEVLDLVRRLAS
jgi:MerR family transcriptional regulator, light-induced transcriptional regulator